MFVLMKLFMPSANTFLHVLVEVTKLWYLGTCFLIFVVILVYNQMYVVIKL